MVSIQPTGAAASARLAGQLSITGYSTLASLCRDQHNATFGPRSKACGDEPASGLVPSGDHR